MTPRHLVLVVSSAAVLAMGLYLWREVSATPAPVESSKPEKHPIKVTEDTAPEPEKEPDQVAAVPEVKRPVRDATPIKAPPPPTNTEAPTLTGSDPIAEELAKPNAKLDSVMAEANKAYDHGDFDEAKGIALKVLAKDPTNVRMLRIAVSASCIDGDSTEAQRHYTLLPGPDREAMKIRCGRYGINFTDK
ncbi:MAG: hypothetical protein ABI175_16875 [Polyangiales bacterium]